MPNATGGFASGVVATFRNVNYELEALSRVRLEPCYLGGSFPVRPRAEQARRSSHRLTCLSLSP